MEAMKNFVVGAIDKGGYKLEKMQEKIVRLFALDHLTEQEMDYCLQYAADKADNSVQVDMLELIADLQHRVEALETQDYVVWYSGKVTAKGEIVKFDLDGDGTYDYVMYDGGRTETALGVGAINGWYKVTSNGVKTHTVVRNADRVTYTITPLEQE